MADTVAVIIEPIQGEGGIHVATAEFLQALCASFAMSMSADFDLRRGAVRLGHERGRTLWGHSFAGISPDIMTLAKPLAGGLPIGAILVTDAVSAAMQPGRSRLDLFRWRRRDARCGSRGEACAQRRASWRACQGSRRVSCLSGLAELNSPHIKDVRGRGLIAGIELDVAPAGIVNAGYEHGSAAGQFGHECYPLCAAVTLSRKRHVDELIDKLTVILEGIDDED